MDNVDYRKYYHLEKYLFEEVSKRFELEQTLNAFDFFCIVIWKANRAKSKVAERLLSKGYNDLDKAVKKLIKNIVNNENEKSRMKVLISDWRFRLPMASAILTVLYPNAFTVYDVRVCEVLENYRNIQNRSNFENLWSGYVSYMHDVKNSIVENYTLRDKDRWLWGKSFFAQLKEDIKKKYRIIREENKTKA